MDPIITQPQQSQYQAPTPEHKHFLNKKFVITFVVLLLLGGGAYAGIWYWQNQQIAQEVVPTFTPRTDATAGWKTYTNTQYGITFKYPLDFTITDNVANFCQNNPSKCYLEKDNLDLTISHNGSYEGSISYNAKTSFFNPPPAIDMAQWLKTNNLLGDGQIINDGYRISDLPTLHTFQTGGNGGTKDILYFIQNNRLFELILDAEDTPDLSAQKGKTLDLNDSAKWYNAFLKSLKFTNFTDTSAWKTYTNTQYGFTVKYPLDYRVNPFGQPTEKGLAVHFVQTGPEGTDLPNFEIWIITSALSPEAWLKSAAASSIIGDLTYHHISTYTIGQRTIVDATPTELGTHARVFSEGGRIVMFADVSGVTDPVPSAIQTFKFTK